MTLFADPDFGYEFSHWTSTTNSLGLIDSTTSSITSIQVQGDASYTANFSVINYELQVLDGRRRSSSLSRSPGDQSALSMVQVSAVPQEGYDFDALGGSR